jgi:hypothetical protein
MKIYTVSLRSIVRVFGNPMKTHTWGHEPFDSRNVKTFIKRGIFESRPWDGKPGSKFTIHKTSEATREYHIARIAYMVINPQSHPICLEIMCPDIGLYDNSIYDGNHRLAAAIVRKDKTINVTFGGGVDNFYRMFPKRNTL